MKLQLSKQKENSLYWIVITLAFIYVCLRIFRLSISHDEALTYLNHARGPWKDVLLYRGQILSNSHFLNTLLIKICISFLGISEGVLRLPALAGFILYVSGMRKIMELISTGSRVIAVFAVLVLNPYLLDLFSCGRGYALALGFMSWGLLFFLKSMRNYAHAGGSKNIFLAFTFFGLSALSHFSFLIIYAACGMIYFIKIFFCRIKKNNSYVSPARLLLDKFAYPAFPASTVLFFICYVPVRAMLKTDDFFEGGEIGFWQDTVLSIIKVNAYGQVSLRGVILPAIFVGLVLILAGMVLLHRKFMKKEAFLGQSSLLNLFLLLVIPTAIIVAMNKFLGVKYAMDRRAVYFLPIFWLLALALWDKCSCQPFIKKVSNGISAFVVIIVMIHFIGRGNISSFYYFRYDASSKDVVKYLSDLNKHASSGGSIKTIGAHWVFLPSIAFYKDKFDLDWLDWPYRIEVQKPFDYYYLLTPQSPDVKRFDLVMDLEKIKKAKRIKSFPVSDSYLAVPLEKNLLLGEKLIWKKELL